MQTSIKTIGLLAALAMGLTGPLFSQVPDLTAAGAIAALKTDPKSFPVYSETYNLGATGMRGWIYTTRSPASPCWLRHSPFKERNLRAFRPTLTYEPRAELNNEGKVTKEQ